MTEALKMVVLIPVENTFTAVTVCAMVFVDKITATVIVDPVNEVVLIDCAVTLDVDIFEE